MSILKNRDLTFKIKVEDAYVHIVIHPESQKYLLFMNRVLNTAALVSHHVAGYPHCQGGASLHRRFVRKSPGLRLTPQPPDHSAANARFGRLLIKYIDVGTGASPKDSVPQSPNLPRSWEGSTTSLEGLGDSNHLRHTTVK